MQSALSRQSWKIPAAYRPLRWMARLGVWLFLPKVRLLNEEKLKGPGHTLLVVNYPESFLAAIFLMAAFDRPVLCLVSSRSLRGSFLKLLSRGMGILTMESLPDTRSERTAFFAAALANWGALALFAGNSGANGGRGASDGGPAARRVLEALQQREEQLPLYAVHVFLPPGDRKSDLLVSVDGPHQDAASPAASKEGSSQAPPPSDAALLAALQKNVFALEEEEIESFHRELEAVAHEDLGEEWSRRPNWKQQAEDLHLSGFVKQWIDIQNQINPGRLVALRKLVEDYREARRRCSLGRLRVETSSLWQESGLSVAAAWVESLLGFPVALYGFLNHIPSLAILSPAGLLKKSGGRDPKVEWLLRASAVMGCYILQVWLLHLWLGRAAAGYYALTLPVSGAYLWRYLWLVRNRSHLLWLKAILPARSARLRRARKALLGRFEDEVNLYAQSLGMPT